MVVNSAFLFAPVRRGRAWKSSGFFTCSAPDGVGGQDVGGGRPPNGIECARLWSLNNSKGSRPDDDYPDRAGYLQAGLSAAWSRRERNAGAAAPTAARR